MSKKDAERFAVQCVAATAAGMMLTMGIEGYRAIPQETDDTGSIAIGQAARNISGKANASDANHVRTAGAMVVDKGVACTNTDGSRSEFTMNITMAQPLLRGGQPGPDNATSIKFTETAIDNNGNRSARYGYTLLKSYNGWSMEVNHGEQHWAYPADAPAVKNQDAQPMASDMLQDVTRQAVEDAAEILHPTGASCK
jgi:hypothetical protein